MRAGRSAMSSAHERNDQAGDDENDKGTHDEYDAD